MLIIPTFEGIKVKATRDELIGTDLYFRAMTADEMVSLALRLFECAKEAAGSNVIALIRKSDP